MIDHGRVVRRADHRLPLFASGKLKPLIGKVYSFDELPKAKDHMESNAAVGKIVVRM